MIAAPRWSEAELGEFVDAAEAAFRRERMTEPLEKWLGTFDAYRARFTALLDRTGDLATLGVDELIEAEELVRYLAGPPISFDDLKVVADTSLAAKVLRADTEAAGRVLDAIRTGLDRRRFPWVGEGRGPTPEEREAAIVASAALISAQRLATDRRNEGKEMQELAVCAALEASGFRSVPTRTIQVLTDAPRRGEFCRESMLGSRKADVVVGMWDGRVMPIEAKVSNSAINSIKRLNNDAAVKAVRWIEEFGRVQMVPAAVLGGVYKLHNVVAAQAQGLTIWWAHDLGRLTGWLDRAR